MKSWCYVALMLNTGLIRCSGSLVLLCFPVKCSFCCDALLLGALKVSCSAALLLFCYVALVFWCSAVVLSPLFSQGFLCPFVLYCCSALVFVLLQAVMDSAALVLCSSALMLFSCFHASLLPCFHCLFCIRRPSALPASRWFRSISLGSSVQSRVQRLFLCVTMLHSH